MIKEMIAVQTMIMVMKSIFRLNRVHPGLENLTTRVTKVKRVL